MSSRKPSLWLVAASAVLPTACSVVPPQPAATAPYFIDGRGAVTTDIDYVERYACASGKPLSCSCTSSKLGKCDCSC